MKKTLIIIMSLVAILTSYASYGSHDGRIASGLRGSDKQRIRLTPKHRKLTKDEIKEQQERARIFEIMEENRYRTYYDPSTGVMFQSTPANMRTPYQKWLYNQLKNKKMTTPKNTMSK